MSVPLSPRLLRRIPTRYVQSDRDSLFLRFASRNLGLDVAADGFLAAGLFQWHVLRIPDCML